MRYQLIALDVDGTTVNTGRPASPRVLAALAAAQQRGVHLVLATGRGFDSAHAYAQALGLHDPLICFQGALVKEQTDRQPVLFADSMPLEPLEEVIAFADRRELELTLYTEADLYVQRQYHPQEFYDLWFGLPTHRVPDLAAAARNLFAQGQPLLKGLFTGEPADLDALEPELADLVGDRLAVTRSHQLFLEVVAASASKGRALAFLAERYGIPQPATIAIGDSANDLSMIRWAGLGVAMANAQPEVRSAANWIAPSVEEDGVAVVIEKFILANGSRG